MPEPTNQGPIADEPIDQPATTTPSTPTTPVDEVTEINPDVDITPEDIGVPVVAEGERLLEVDAVTLRFGGVVALDEVSFHINKGEILGLIGPNGAGKTTCFNVMTGVYQPTSGAVKYLGKPLGKRHKFQITKLGIARTFQNIRLFANMTALENVLVGVDAHHTTGVVTAMFRLPKHRREEARAGLGLRSCSSSWASTARPTSSRATCPTATSVGSRSPGPSPRARSCSASTSLRPASTRPRRSS